MNYGKIYDSLVQKFRFIQVEIGENHHIIPRCVDGSDESNNMVRLPSREHFFAHQLLCKMYPNNKKLIYALNMMCCWGDGSGHHRTSKRYGWIRDKFIRNHPTKDLSVREKISNGVKRHNKEHPEAINNKIETRKRNHPAKGNTMIEKVCDCGCGESIFYKKGDHPTMYVKGHYKPKPQSKETREKCSRIAKTRLSLLTEQEMTDRMNNSVRRYNDDPEHEKRRGENISKTKRAKYGVGRVQG